MDEDTGAVYGFHDQYGRTGRLILEAKDLKRLDQHSRSEQRDGAFVLRNTDGKDIFIEPHAKTEGPTAAEEYADVQLSSGGRARLTLETYAAFIRDVQENRAGSYQAETIV